MYYDKQEHETEKIEAQTRKTKIVYCIDKKTVCYYPTCRNINIHPVTKQNAI